MARSQEATADRTAVAATADRTAVAATADRTAVATAPSPRWQRLDHDERRSQILACARRLFSERNYAAGLDRRDRREAGVARGLLHHYFGTKRELYLEVVREPGADALEPGPAAGAGRGRSRPSSTRASSAG